MSNYTREELDKEFKTIKRFREDTDGKIELIEHEKKNIRLIKRTYYEDKREIFELLSKVKADNLARIEAVFFDTDTIVLEEYIEGERLSEYLCHCKVSSKQASEFILELLHAVSAIHQMGIIHRDIKPENILIDKSGHLHLIDFGIARIYRPGKGSDTRLLGTVGYAAPEQFGYSQSDFRSDIYSIGVTCRDINRVCKKNRLLQKIEQKCMKMDPEERYPNISKILVEFRKKKAAWGGTALVGILLIFLAAGAYFFCQQKELEEKSGDLVSVLGEHMLFKGLDESGDLLSEPGEQMLFEGSDESGDLLSEPGEHMLFEGPDDALYLMLTEDTEKRAQISLAEEEEPIEVAAKLTAEGLSLAITDTSGSSTDYMLSNQYEIPVSYSDTSLYAEVLFFDTDHDGRDEIWVAVSDRALVEWLNGHVHANQNYMAGWCIFQDEDGNFCLADGQLLTKGKFEIGTVVDPNGIWQEYEFELYELEDGSLVNIPLY